MRGGGEECGEMKERRERGNGGWVRSGMSGVLRERGIEDRGNNGE